MNSAGSMSQDEWIGAYIHEGITMNEMRQLTDTEYKAAMQIIDMVMALDPATDTPLGHVLDYLSTAVQEYETNRPGDDDADETA